MKVGLLFITLFLFSCNEYTPKDVGNPGVGDPDTGDGGDTGGTTDPEPKFVFAHIEKKIFKKYRCTVCHNQAMAPKGVDLSSYKTTMETVDLDHPEASRLYKSVAPEGTMPPNSSLEPAELDYILSWIEKGAEP